MTAASAGSSASASASVRRLAAPAPGWTTTADVVVVGSGVAGLTTALRVRAAGLRVLVVTKAVLDEGSTRWAQGGIAAALGEGDSPEQHLADTLVAGAGLCDEDAVRMLVTEGPGAVRRLIETGAAFDRDAEGEILLTREGGHHRRRIAHAGGDATGAEISRALVEAVRDDEGIELIEHALVLDLLTDAEGRTAGLTLHVMGEGQRDGVALALRAGAEVADLEFVQFHPTVLWLGPDAEGQQPLISEAVRGEGAHLVDADGVRFMVGQHELAELAPRDIVAKGIMRRMAETGAEHMFLDGRHFGAQMWEERFPTILASCRAHGIDPVTGLIPVAPAAHYASGGVRTDLCGHTSVSGLYACGEAACTGVHGANRLASNSLLEGLVFAERIASDIIERDRAGKLTPRHEDTSRPVEVVPLLAAESRAEIQRVMTRGVGVLRSASSMAEAAERLAALAESVTETEKQEPVQVETWEATNLHLVASALTAAALLREETRGCHWREDAPDRDDARWRRHLVTTLVDGSLHVD
jgi:L-aspartate oxidase